MANRAIKIAVMPRNKKLCSLLRTALQIDSAPKPMASRALVVLSPKMENKAKANEAAPNTWLPKIFISALCAFGFLRAIKISMFSLESVDTICQAAGSEV